MGTRAKTVSALTLLSVILLGLPLLGVALTGAAVEAYLEFPPRTRFVEHAPFSWGGFALMGLLSLLLFGGLIWLLQPWQRDPGNAVPGRPFPWWGWLGALWLGLSWGLAWSPLNQRWGLASYSFTAIWIGYIVVANGLAWKRSGRSLLTHRPGLLLALFPFSAVFWWYFEYLNRFVQNWHYLGIASGSVRSYVLHASLAFATVLPALVSTMDWLRTLPGLAQARRTRGFPDLDVRRLAWWVLGIGALGLLGIGLWPNQLYALVWGAPVLVLLALQTLLGERTWLHPVREGRWEPVALPALAALVLGLLWEMWNFYSAPKWVYSVPYVHRFEIFEMPLLGYTGYLPFGIACIVFADAAARLLGPAPQSALEGGGAERGRGGPARAGPPTGPTRRSRSRAKRRSRS